MHIEDEVIDAALIANKQTLWMALRDDAKTEVRNNMRAAADVLVPVLLAKALAEPSEAELKDAFSYSEGAIRCVRNAFANRLRSLQAKPDPRVAMIMEELRERDISTDDRTFTERILNALDEYDRRDATK